MSSACIQAMRNSRLSPTAIDSRLRRVWLAGAGAAFAGSVHTNVVWSIMLPALAYYYVVTTRESRTGRVLTDWTFALLGSTTLTLVIAAASMANGGTFLFFMPSVNYAINSPPPQTPSSWLELSTWVIRGRFLLFPAAVLVSMVYFRAARARLGEPQARRRDRRSVAVAPAELDLGPRREQPVEREEVAVDHQ